MTDHTDHTAPAADSNVAAQVRLDLDAIEAKWLQQWGSCDAGLPMNCSHPDEDYRPVMLAFVREVTALRAELDAARAYLALHLSPECQHINAHSGCDETVVCKGRCWCACHNEEATDG